MRLPLVVGNWKMHGSLASNRALLDGVAVGVARLASIEVGVCVPFPYLAQAQQVLGGLSMAWGAQNVSEHASGAYTGEVSAAMLTEFGCKYVLVGHSERRALYAESDQQVAAKFVAAKKSGLVPILCVGEQLAERESGATERVVGRQLEAVLNAAGVGAFEQAVVAYEPVWAIGTGKTASPEQAQAVHASLRGMVGKRDASVASGLRILYGGSVKPGNAAELFGMADIDGGLVGGAALVAAEFTAICAAAVR